MVYYSHKKFTVRVERAEEDGILNSMYGDFFVKAGDLICTDETGNQFVATEKYFQENYLPVKKMYKTKTTRKSPFELAALEDAYKEMGELVKQSNEEGQNYIFEPQKAF